MRRHFVLAFLIGAAAAAHASSAQQQLKPGKWIIEVKMEVPNLPGGAMPPTKAIVCVDEAASKKPWLISAQQRQGGDCQFGEPKVTGNKLTTTMTCQGGMVKGQFDVEVKNNGEAYTGVGTMTVGPQSMKTMYDGTWQSATCDKD